MQSISTLFKYSKDRISIYCNSLDDFITNDIILLIEFEMFMSRENTRLDIITVDQIITKSDYLMKVINKHDKSICWLNTKGIQKEIVKNKHITYMIGDESMLIYRYDDKNECNFNSAHAKGLLSKFNSNAYFR